MRTLVDRLRVDEPRQPRWKPRRTDSLCPQCLAVVPAELDSQDGKIFMYKSCPEHGRFRELISDDVDFFMRLERLATTIDPAEPRAREDVAADDTGPLAQAGTCPMNCGICPEHRSQAMMINIDLTNRCNLRCPICFANSDATGYVFEVTREQVREMMLRALRTNDPGPPCIQFAGGEPTLHADFVEILSEARELGFPQIQVASNGIRFAREPDYARACADAGLNIVYLQFDGLSEDVYRQTRGARLVDLKSRAIDNVYQAGMRTCLVPTIVKGLNDKEIGPILRFAVQNTRQILAISWQPVAFTGRIDERERMSQRFTLTDLARCIEQQTGLVEMHRDWYPYSFVEPFSQLMEAITGERPVRPSCHAHCGMATYLVVNARTREAATIPQMVDVEPMMKEIGRLAAAIKRQAWRGNRWYLSLAWRRLRKFFRAEAAVTGWDFNELANFMASFVDFGSRYPDNEARRRELEGTEVHALLLQGMHFQDAYNFELDRVRRCVVHYAAPDGRMYPFCTYNCGPVFRDRVEQQFARLRATGRASPGQSTLLPCPSSP